jgi:ABC-type uncharacterized transport system substrate-binding protein
MIRGWAISDNPQRVLGRRRGFVRMAVLILALSAFHAPAAAHPHVFVATRYTLVFDDAGLAGLRVNWRFDEMFSTMIAEDFDRNRDGAFDAAESAAVEQGVFRNLAQFGFFTHVEIDGKPFAVEFVKDFVASRDGRVMVYSFLVPCHVPAGPQPRRIKVSPYDPEYYAAVFFARDRPVTLENADGFKVESRIIEDHDTTIYFGMIHPWTLIFTFKPKTG